MSNLPGSLKLYFAKSLPQSENLPSLVELKQEGRLRIDMENDKWFGFCANEIINVYPPRFSWQAKVKLMPFIKITVTDGYKQGIGSGAVRFGKLNIVSEKNRPELNQAALHRYLAEAPWCPPALLPRHGLAWSPIGDNRALARLTESCVTVDLEFEFAPSGDIVRIYSPGRWMKQEGSYIKTPWQGTFSDHIDVEGMRLPRKAEVSWQVNGQWEPVWKGEILEAIFKQV